MGRRRNAFTKLRKFQEERRPQKPILPKMGVEIKYRTWKRKKGESSQKTKGSQRTRKGSN